MGTPHRVCRTFARLDFILVPLPAARITAKIGELSDIYPHHSYRSRLGRQDSNLRSRDQNPVPCLLATPQYRPPEIIPERLFVVRKVCAPPELSEHGMVVRRALRHGLQHVPVLYYLAVLQAEEVGRGGAPVFRRGFEQAVRYDHIALG